MRWLQSPWRRAVLIVLLVLCLTSGGVFTYFYLKYANMIQGKLDGGPFSDLSVLYASPRPISVGEETTAADIATYLRRTGYSEDSNRSRVGWYRLRADGIEINPGPDAYDSEGGVIKVSGGKVTQIISLHDQAERAQYLLEPEPITNLFDKERQKRRIVHFEDIPKVMVNAALSAEDKNFFRHAGFDPIGIIRAAYKDLVGERLEGASTITQQLATTLWLDDEKRDWRRKVAQTLITLHLERKLSKQQIFEYYANSIYVGNQGSFSIHGFAQGAQAYFGKDLRQITLPEAALLAGLPQGPGTYDPFRHKDRALVRRNIVLKAMLKDEAITQKEYDEAVATELKVNRESIETSDAPYFVDLVTDTMRTKFPALDPAVSSYRVYTTLNLELQRDAVEAVRIGIKETDDRWKKRDKKYGTATFPQAQVALVVLDTETGEVLALVGGRSYGSSQLDHATKIRQPGSSFKPFVYAAAMATALDPASPVILTPASTVIDEPTTFWFNDQPPYEPKNHGGTYEGEVTLRRALAHSWNIPAVKVAQMVGYDKVAATARAAGLNINIKPTPSIALGAYEVTPLEIAGAYTVFANKGDLIPPTFIKSIRQREGGSLFQAKPERKVAALDPRVAYVVQNMMQEVLRSGTGAGVRGRGFLLPAAAKTGTSRDAWFAGFTSKLLAVVWVGFDDNRDFQLEGAQSALPIWTEFMKRAHAHREYKNVHEFEAPDGIVSMEVDDETGQIATSACPKIHTEVFIAGSQPLQLCRLHNRGGATTISSGWEPQQAKPVVNEDPQEAQQPRVVARAKTKNTKVIPIEPEKPAKAPEAKPGFWDRVRGIFGR